MRSWIWLAWALAGGCHVYDEGWIHPVIFADAGAKSDAAKTADARPKNVRTKPPEPQSTPPGPCGADGVCPQTPVNPPAAVSSVCHMAKVPERPSQPAAAAPEPRSLAPLYF